MQRKNLLNKPVVLVGLVLFYCFAAHTQVVAAKEPGGPTATTTSPARLKNDPPAASPALAAFCTAELGTLPGPYDKASLERVCQHAQQLDICESVNKAPIIHFNQPGTDAKGKRILSIALIHGDEAASGSVTRAWMSRLQGIEPRNTWRVLPLVNPDGLKARTRTNAHKVDVNRNFPSADWDKDAIKYWQSKTKNDPRRNPGTTAASEPETRCLMKHIDEFKPDFIISIHTPLGVLDFDGPKIGNPGFKPLPWVGLGNYVGSLGRYMWMDRKVPVLTIELKGNSGLQRLEDFDKLQDISGTVAIQSARLLEQEKNEKKK